MHKREVIEHFGNVQKVADLLGVTHAAVSKWPEKLSDKVFDRVIGAAVRKGVDIPDAWRNGNGKAA